jgi:hypothetical protein
LALGLGLIAEENGPAVGLAGEAHETIGETVIAILGAGDFGGTFAGELFAHGGERAIVGVERFVDTGGEEAGFEAGGAEHGLLGESHAFEGEEFLRVDGLIDGDEIGFELLDLVEVFEADDGEVRGGEAVLEGVLGGAGFAFGRLGSGGVSGVGAVGGEAFGRDGFWSARHFD